MESIISYIVKFLERYNISVLIVPLIMFSLMYYLLYIKFPHKDDSKDKFYKYVGIILIVFTLIMFIIYQLNIIF